jgi:hypothetical protein
MSKQLYEVVISAVGEVRDKDGKLISSEPIQVKQVMTEAQIKELRGEA